MKNFPRGKTSPAKSLTAMSPTGRAAGLECLHNQSGNERMIRVLFLTRRPREPIELIRQNAHHHV